MLPLYAVVTCKDGFGGKSHPRLWSNLAPAPTIKSALLTSFKACADLLECRWSKGLEGSISLSSIHVSHDPLCGARLPQLLSKKTTSSVGACRSFWNVSRLLQEKRGCLKYSKLGRQPGLMTNLIACNVTASLWLNQHSDQPEGGQAKCQWAVQSVQFVELQLYNFGWGHCPTKQNVSYLNRLVLDHTASLPTGWLN